MRVLMWLSHGGEVPGGHRVQMERTAAALRALDVHVDEHLGPDIPRGRWDIVHGFQLQPADLEASKRRGLPVVVSPIYVGLSYSSSGPSVSVSPRALAGRINRGARYFRSSVRGRETLTRLSLAETWSDLAKIAAWSMADMLLPNAEGEAQHIRADLGVLTETHVVPNAIDVSLFSPGFTKSRDPGTVLCVGRVEPHKNQLGLIRALRGIEGISVTIVGPPHPHHVDYYEQCRRAAGANVAMLPEVPHEELPDLYARHRTHVLASWYETTGLVSLEAAASGCTVVTTNRGHAAEYFGADASYCDPADPASVRRAVLRAVSGEPPPALLQRIRANYSWSHTAQVTLDAYHTVLLRRRHA
ncbi:glycosyltransferase family 4 protein [Ornithinimicrobium sp. W1679]|uniref:glycosyltransferase family 4 protein n=1 Tax=Ornithinimicrobium sp. W1679 TaxID=3418770 RepID=UPI003CE772A5